MPPPITIYPNLPDPMSSRKKPIPMEDYLWPPVDMPNQKIPDWLRDSPLPKQPLEPPQAQFYVEVPDVPMAHQKRTPQSKS